MVEALTLRPITAEAPILASERQTREVTREDVRWLQLSLSLQHVRIQKEHCHYAPNITIEDKKKLKELRHSIKKDLGIRRSTPIDEVDQICANIAKETGVYAHQLSKVRERTESLLFQKAHESA